MKGGRERGREGEREGEKHGLVGCECCDSLRTCFHSCVSCRTARCPLHRLQLSKPAEASVDRMAQVDT